MNENRMQTAVAWAEARTLVEAWNVAAQERDNLANECRSKGQIDEALPLENAAKAYRRCASKLQAVIDRAQG